MVSQLDKTLNSDYSVCIYCLERQTLKLAKHVIKSFPKTCLCSPDKKELLSAAKANAMEILRVENLELPESVKPILSEQSVESKWVSLELETRVRQDPEKTSSQVGF